MKWPFARNIAIGLASAVAVVWLPLPEAGACGFPWIEPKSYFENVDYQGHVHVVEKLAELEIDGLYKPLPIYVVFNSSYGIAPHAGAFEIPLLESKIVQLDENNFLLRSPSGWLLPFLRTKDKTILNGAMGMKAEIKEDRITVWSDCGDRLVFQRGRLVEIEQNGVKLLYSYQGDKVSQIRDGFGKPIMEVRTDAQTRKVMELVIPQRNPIQFSWGTKPVVQVFQGKRLIGGTVDAVTKFTLPTGDTKSFEFEVDGDLLPLIKCDGDERLAWNPETLLIEKSREWSYSVKPVKERFEYAAIDRVDSGGRRESWHRDSMRGTETWQKDGVRSVSSYFASGRMTGALRKIEVLREGQTQKEVTYQASYNEEGNLIRELSQETLREFDKSGVVQKVVSTDGKVLYQQVESAVPISAEGFVTSVLERATGKELRMYRDNRLLGSLELDEKGRVIKINNE